MPDNSSRSAARHRRGFHCPRCGLYGVQEWAELGSHLQDEFGEWYFELLDTEAATGATHNVFEDAANGYSDAADPWSPPEPWLVPGLWARSRCVGCGKSTVWFKRRIVFPGARAVSVAHVDMPERPRQLYEEAALVMGVSRRAGAAMARATLERLLVEIGPDCPPKSSLDDRIVRVIRLVPSSLGEVLTVIRHVGNRALHVDDVPDDALVLILDEGDAEIVEILFSAINDLVDELVTKPASRHRLLDAVPARVREGVERKKAAAEVAEA